MGNNDLVKELASLNNKFISAEQVNFKHIRCFEGLNQDIAPSSDMTLYLNSNSAGGGSTVSVRDRHNSFKVIKPMDPTLNFYTPFESIIDKNCLTVVKLIYVDTETLAKPFPMVEYAEDCSRQNIETMIAMEQNSPDFGLYQTHEQTARLKALKDLSEVQDRVGVCKDYIALYVKIPLSDLTPGIPYYVECLDILVRVERFREEGNMRVIDTDAQQHYIHPYSNKGSNYIVERTIEKLRQNISALNVQVKSNKRQNAENAAYHVQFDKIIEIPITDVYHLGDEGVYLTYQNPKNGTIDSIVIPLDQAHTVGVFFNLSEAKGKKQAIETTYEAEKLQKQEKEKAEYVRTEEAKRKYEDESAKRTLEKIKLAAAIIGGLATAAGAIYGLVKLFFGTMKSAVTPFTSTAHVAW